MKKIVTFQEYQKKKIKKKAKKKKKTTQEEEELQYPVKTARQFHNLAGYNSWGGNQNV